MQLWYASMQLHMYACIHLSLYESMQANKYKIMQVFKCAGMKLCKYPIKQVSLCASIYTSMLVQFHANNLVCKYEFMQVFMCVRETIYQNPNCTGVMHSQKELNSKFALRRVLNFFQVWLESMQVYKYASLKHSTLLVCMYA